MRRHPHTTERSVQYRRRRQASIPPSPFSTPSRDLRETIERCTVWYNPLASCMPPALLSRDDVVDRLMTVFRHAGYDGTSLSELSKATGLGKSSLYHYFPNGKDDMLLSVLERLATQLRASLFEPLRGPGIPRKRITAMIRTLDAFYAHGNESCLLAQVVLGGTRARFRAPMRAIFAEWMDAIACALVDAGVSKTVARHRAEDAVVRIEGALVLAGGMDDVQVFARMLKQLPVALLA